MGSRTRLVLDWTQLRNVTLNDEVLMRELVGTLVSDATQQIEHLRLAMDQSDAKECVRLAHGLKGACGNIGAASMAALFYEVERSAALGDLERCRPSMERLFFELERLRSEASSI